MDQLPRYMVERFQQEGFLQLPGVFSAVEVARFRDEVDRAFSEPGNEGDSERFRFDVMNRYPLLRSAYFHPALVSALRSLLGDDFVYLPETSIQKAAISQWHKDTTAQEHAGLLFHQEPDCRFVQIAFYLQDNDPVFGGALDVVPGSHRLPDRYAHKGFIAKMEARLFNRGLLPRRWSGRPGLPVYSIPSRAGDVLLFDFRVDHRGTPPAAGAREIRRDKQVFFIAASANNRHARTYLDFIKARQDLAYIKDYRYDDEVRRIAAAAGVTLG